MLPKPNAACITTELRSVRQSFQTTRKLVITVLFQDRTADSSEDYMRTFQMGFHLTNGQK